MYISTCSSDLCQVLKQYSILASQHGMHAPSLVSCLYFCHRPASCCIWKMRDTFNCNTNLQIHLCNTFCSIYILRVCPDSTPAPTLTLILILILPTPKPNPLGGSISAGGVARFRNLSRYEYYCLMLVLLLLVIAIFRNIPAGQHWPIRANVARFVVQGGLASCN